MALSILCISSCRAVSVDATWWPTNGHYTTYIKPKHGHYSFILLTYNGLHIAYIRPLYVLRTAQYFLVLSKGSATLPHFICIERDTYSGAIVCILRERYLFRRYCLHTEREIPIQALLSAY